LRSYLRRLRVDKRGLSGVVSSLFILIIAIAMVGFIYETYNVQTQMSEWDADRVRERTEVNDVFFGEMNQYSPSSTTPSSGPIANLEKLDKSYLQFDSSKSNQVVTSITNMNFSSGTSGWNFCKDVGSQLIESGYSIQLGNPAPGSGLGSVYVQMNGLGTGPYWMNWTYFFSYSQSEPRVTYLSWAKNIWDRNLTSSGTLYVTLALPNGAITALSGPTDIFSLELKSWYYDTILLNSGIISSSGTYALTLAVLGSTMQSGNPHDSGNLVVFFDDVGISNVLGKVYSSDFFGTFNTGKDPSCIRNIQVNYAGHYTPWSGTTSNAPTSTTALGNTHIVGGSYQNLAIKDGNPQTFESYSFSIPQKYNPSAYTLLGGTTLQSGSTGDLASDDGTYQSFRSYQNFSDIHQFTNNAMSNVDASPSKGAHLNFTAQQNGPDSIYDKITEENTGGGSSSFGSSTSTTYTTVSADYTYGSLFTSPSDAEGSTLQNITWYGRGDFFSGNAKAILVLHSTLQIVAVSDVSSFTTTAAERTCTFSSPPTISANTQYILMMIFSVSTRFYYGTGSTNQGHYDVSNSYLTPTNPTDAAHNNNQYRILANYVRANNYELDLETQWTNVNYAQSHEELAIYANKSINTFSLDATGGYMIASGNPNWGSVTGTISFWVKWDVIGGRPWGQSDNMETRFSGTNLVLDWGGTDSIISSTSFVSGKWYFIAIVWNENTNQLYLYVGDKTNPPTQDTYDNAWASSVSTSGVIQNTFLASKGGVDPIYGHGDELRYWNTDKSLVEIQSNYNKQLTGSESSLRSYFKLDNNFDDSGPANNDGAGSGSYSFQADTPFGVNETIRVDVWDGSSWQNVFADLSNGWNNVSVSSYLTSQTFTIRLKGGTETSDITQDYWEIDAALLHTWTNKNIIEVELSGSSNNNNWASLNWTINSAWTVSDVSVSIQLFNYSLAQYPTNGNGYINYTSGAPNTDKNDAESINSNPTTFRNESGGWKIKIKGVKENTSQFSFLCDLVELRPANYNYAVDWYGEFEIEGFALLNQFDISYWGYFNASTIYQTIFLYNFNTSAYDQIGANQLYSTAGVGQWHNYTINSNLANYVSSSDSLKIRFLSGGNSTQFKCYADYTNIGVSGASTNLSTIQKLYIMDYTNDEWHLLSTSNIDQNDQQEGPIQISDNLSNYVDSQGHMILRVNGVSQELASCQANFMMIRLYTFNQSKITLEVTNLGSETVDLERVWVNNSTGHTKIDLLPGENIDRAIISPGEKAIIQIDYTYSTCQYTFKVTTQRGTIAAYVKTAS
jgi:hypothetical protein